jgi:hypothetical protein
MPRSPDADRELAAARAAIASRDYARAAGHTWTGAAAAASIGDQVALTNMLELTDSLAVHDDVEQLRLYIRAALEDAKRGTRPPSAFERLLKRDLRPR